MMMIRIVWILHKLYQFDWIASNLNSISLCHFQTHFQAWSTSQSRIWCIYFIKLHEKVNERCINNKVKFVMIKNTGTLPFKIHYYNSEDMSKIKEMASYKNVHYHGIGKYLTDWLWFAMNPRKKCVCWPVSINLL